MNKPTRYPITDQDAATQAEAIVNSQRFRDDIGFHGRTLLYDAMTSKTRPRRRRWGWIGIPAALAATAFALAEPQPQGSPTVTLDQLWRAICLVESGNDANAPDGDGGLAVGIAQIQPILVRDCNDWLGREVFTLGDRRSARLSRLMFDIHCRRYCEGQSAEFIARSWNGGPRWESKPVDVLKRTESYWNRVRRAL